jgi:hypothetical protein
MKRLACLLLTALNLPAVMAGLPPEPAPAEAAAVFTDYSLQDFCLDLRNRLNSKEPGIPTEYLSMAGMVEAVSRHLTGISDTDIAGLQMRIETTMKTRISANLGSHQSVWMMTRFAPRGADRAECILTHDGFIEKDTVFFALRLDLDRWQGRPRILELQDSLYNQPYSRMLGGLFRVVMATRPAETGPLTASAPREPSIPDHALGVATFIEAINAKDKSLIASTYEQLLHPESKALAIFQQYYLDAKSDSAMYPEALARVVALYPANEPLGYRLDLNYLQHDHAGSLRTLDDLEKAWGYHPGLDLLRMQAYRKLNDREGVYRTFATALSKHDGYGLLYWNMMRFLAHERRYPEALQLAEILQHRFEYAMDSPKLEKDEDLREFVQSRLFRDWIKKQQQSHSG